MPRATRRRGRDVLELVDDHGRTTPAVVVSVPVAETRMPESFETFYTRELPRLMVLARALAGDLAAEDIARESMLVAYRRWSEISGLSSPVGYVRGICAHQAVSAVRRGLAERRAPRRYASGRAADLAALPTDSERFWAEVRRLPRRQAQAAALFYALDLSVADVAATLSCAEGTVKAHLSRARQELARRLETWEDLS
jgi:RNA polymerase sigma-70 factor (ECF subfamily)